MHTGMCSFCGDEHFSVCAHRSVCKSVPSDEHQTVFIAPHLENRIARKEVIPLDHQSVTLRLLVQYLGRWYHVPVTIRAK